METAGVHFAAGTVASPAALSRPARLLFLFGGVFLPLTGVLAMFLGTGPEWQSGSIADMFALVLVQARWACLPLFAYSLGSMILLVASPGSLGRAGRHFAVRFGVYTGAMLCAEGAFLFAPIISAGFNAATWALWCGNVLAALATVWILGPVTQPLDGERIGCGVIAWVAIVCVASLSTPLSCLLLTLAPGCACGVYLSMARLVFRANGGRLQFRLSHALSLVTWLGAQFAALRVGVELALARYADLPKNRPPSDCYVCTAAAHGHRWLVGSREVQSVDGTRVAVNAQMRHLKCAELVLAAVCPRLHRRCRRLYDTVGPPLAASIQSAILADVAYLSLKPLEWGARGALAMVLATSRCR